MNFRVISNQLFVNDKNLQRELGLDALREDISEVLIGKTLDDAVCLAAAFIENVDNYYQGRNVMPTVVRDLRMCALALISFRHTVKNNVLYGVQPDMLKAISGDFIVKFTPDYEGPSDPAIYFGRDDDGWNVLFRGFKIDEGTVRVDGFEFAKEVLHDVCFHLLEEDCWMNGYNFMYDLGEHGRFMRYRVSK